MRSQDGHVRIPARKCVVAPHVRHVMGRSLPGDRRWRRPCDFADRVQETSSRRAATANPSATTTRNRERSTEASPKKPPATLASTAAAAAANVTPMLASASRFGSGSCMVHCPTLLRVRVPHRNGPILGGALHNSWDMYRPSTKYEIGPFDSFQPEHRVCVVSTGEVGRLPIDGFIGPHAPHTCPARRSVERRQGQLSASRLSGAARCPMIRTTNITATPAAT